MGVSGIALLQIDISFKLFAFSFVNPTLAIFFKLSANIFAFSTLPIFFKLTALSFVNLTDRYLFQTPGRK